MISTIVSSDRVEGSGVFNTVGDKLGSIASLMIDKQSGQVRYAVLEFGGFLGISTDRYPIPWTLLKYDQQKDGYVVPLDKSKLENAPKFTDGRAPTFDNQFGGHVTAFYSMF